jgi:aminoglycoside 3-N-acetyltransferase I
MDPEMTIRQLLPGDLAEFRELLGVFAKAFEMKGFKMPDDAYLGTLLARRDFIVFVAATPDAVIGGLTAHTLPSYYTESSEAYIYDLAIDSRFRRKGVGRKLLNALADYCRRQGISEFFVQADAPDQHALDFYSASGGIPEQVVHFNFPVGK